jgi:hypothetical protein
MPVRAPLSHFSPARAVSYNGAGRVRPLIEGLETPYGMELLATSPLVGTQGWTQRLSDSHQPLKCRRCNAGLESMQANSQARARPQLDPNGWLC